MKNRKLCGYNVVYVPEHFNCMKSKNWSGYQYEHKYIVEKRLGRALGKDEVVHHKDGNKLNNSEDNLEVVTRSEHAKKHAKHGDVYCVDCGAILANKSAKRCVRCYWKSIRKVAERPTREEIISQLKTESFVAVGKRYGVSDNTIRKWLKRVS